MPFTFSHPAIILPFRYFHKKWFSLTSLVVGSMAPDFEYFIRMKVQSNYSHTLYGVFWFDLPLVLLLSFLFHNVVRNDLFFNSPSLIKSRVLVFTSFNWNHYFKENWAAIVISAFIGILSHLFWDGFTHQQGYFTTHITELKNCITVLGNEIPFWKLAQHLSTVIGAIIIIASFIALPKNTTQPSAIHKQYWIMVITLTFVISILRFLGYLKYLNLGNTIVTVISAFMLSLLISPLLIKFKASLKI
nr:DUF4184 family protein [Flavobacterium sp. ASV13]